MSWTKMLEIVFFTTSNRKNQINRVQTPSSGLLPHKLLSHQYEGEDREKGEIAAQCYSSTIE